MPAGESTTILKFDAFGNRFTTCKIVLSMGTGSNTNAPRVALTPISVKNI